MSKPIFHWEDPLMLDTQLSSEERMIRDAAFEYAQGCLAPRVHDAFRNETTDPAIFREMGDLGLLGITIPEEYGGLGLTMEEEVMVALELGYTSAAFRSALVLRRRVAKMAEKMTPPKPSRSS